MKVGVKAWICWQCVPADPDPFPFCRALFTSQEAVEDDPFLGAALLEQVMLCSIVVEWHCACSRLLLVVVVVVICLSLRVKSPKIIFFKVLFEFLYEFVQSSTLRIKIKTETSLAACSIFCTLKKGYCCFFRCLKFKVFCFYVCLFAFFLIFFLSYFILITTFLLTGISFFRQQKASLEFCILALPAACQRHLWLVSWTTAYNT